MFGTDTIKGQEKEYMDTYIDTNFKQNVDFYIINEELWQFLFQRYGGDVIKRLYVRKNYYTQVEWYLKQVSIKIISAQCLWKGGYDESLLFKKWWTQVSSSASLKDVKKRILDNLNAAGF